MRSQATNTQSLNPLALSLRHPGASYSRDRFHYFFFLNVFSDVAIVSLGKALVEPIVESVAAFLPRHRR